MTTTTSNHRAARVVVAALLVAICSMFLQVEPASAALARGAEDTFESRINTARQNHGLRPLRVKVDLVTLARKQCYAMASSNTLFHSPNLDDTITGARRWGENVAYGYSVASIHRMLMQSPGHRANILSRYYTQMGVGVQKMPDGKLWVTQIFRQPL
ncbi:MAG: CAP domain-containing protein [Actinobacteria bacterium]|nr:CAP domain-containing protein [Actinomycetota bacterium]